MKTMFIALLLCTSLNIVAKSGSPSKYISQEMIDTSILRAFVILNASADMAGVGFGHQRSLKEAKKIAHDLKRRAKGDPNERYVLWKVSELEAQIYLEEQDLILQQMKKRQLTINELVAKYNKEVGKWRPDFATLYRIHKNMDQVDPGKAGELADSYNQRKNALSREVPYFLEKALLAGNADSARKELGYLLRNQLYLNVSSSSYKKLEDRVEGQYVAKEISPVIITQASAAGRLLDRMDIVKARKTLDSAENKLQTIKKHLPQSKSASLTTRLRRVRRKLGAKEDSLVEVNLSILRSRGVEAADQYLQSVLRSYGVSRQKAASVDRAIISAKSPGESATPSAIAELEVDDEGESSQAMDDVMFAAMRKAQVKKDSVQAIENARLWQQRKEQARRDSIRQVQYARQQAAMRKRRQRIDSLTMCIYSFIEKNNVAGAENVFRRETKFLKSNMPEEDFSMLETTITQFTSFTREPQGAITYLSPVAGQESTPEISPQPASTASGSHSSGMVQASVSSPPPQQGVRQSNLERAQKEILGIYTLLEQNQIGRAYKRFQVNKKPLKKYLEPEVFGMLEMTVVQAYDFYTSQR